MTNDQRGHGRRWRGKHVVKSPSFPIKSVTQKDFNSSRKWLGGVINDGNFIKTTPQKVKKAIKRLIGYNANKVKVQVKKHKHTKFFTINLQWDEQLNNPEIDIGFQVDFYFDEDQHNQVIHDIFGYKTFTVLEVQNLCTEKRCLKLEKVEKALENILSIYK